ncbi:MAG TPA: hypothetical protein VIT88_12265 [Pyrinomonadaceae bacterium]
MVFTKNPRVFGQQLIRRQLFLAALFISCIVVSQLSLRAQEKTNLQKWNAAEPLLSQLEADCAIDNFAIRPPKGYSPQTRPGPHGSIATAWAGPPRSDGTRPQVMVLTVRLTPEERQKYRLEQALDELVSSLRARRKDWTMSATEKGLINGLVFVRTRWQGEDLTSGLKMHGFVYVAFVDDMLVQLSSQDVEPHHEAALKLAESSVLTFKKSDSKS